MPALYFGAGAIGQGRFATPENVSGLLEVLKKHSINHIDTAGIYLLTSPGSSEQLLGAAGVGRGGFIIDTKIKMTGEGPGQGSLTKEAIDQSVEMGVRALALGDNNVNVMYCHMPDSITPIEETAEALHRHWTEGKFQHLGLSNYPPDQVEKFLSVCDEHGWVKPSMYQGQYNAVCRNMEKELLPLLRRHGISFVAYSPLAGGLLTGNFSLGNDLSGTRFAAGNMIGDLYRPLYDKPQMHTAIRDLHAFLQPRGVSMVGASLRWLKYHSALGEDDGIILGATKIEQIDDNMAEIAKGPLEASVVDAFEKAWEAVSEVAP